MNYKRYVLLFNICFLLLLIAATLVFEWKPGIAGNKFRPLDIISDIKKDSAGRKTNNNQAIRKDSNTRNNPEIRDYTSYSGLINTDGKRAPLFDFFTHLNELVRKKRKKIRIAYFGDSMVEGDMVTKDIRKMLQDIFGGSGTGFVAITSIVAGDRESITHSFSSDWDDLSFKSKNKASGDLFISGHSFFSAGNSVVSYHAVNRPRLDHFNQVSILFGAPGASGNTSANLLVNGQTYSIQALNPVNKLELDLHGGRELKLGITSTAIPLYGAAFESDSGIVLDNLAFRGISGIELDRFSEKYLKAVQATRPYDLLILHYGPNLLYKSNLTDFSWYIRSMQPILKRIKNAFPETSILLISTADKASKYDGEWHTQKGVKPLIDVQYAIAKNAGADFFNLYNAMGGEDVMAHWVNADTVLAYKDYTHPNERGSTKMAEYIFNAIMKAYGEYEKSAGK